MTKLQARKMEDLMFQGVVGQVTFYYLHSIQAIAPPWSSHLAQFDMSNTKRKSWFGPDMLVRRHLHRQIQHNSAKPVRNNSIC